MVMTFDFFVMARGDEELLKAIKKAMESEDVCEICNDRYRARFQPEEKAAYVTSFSETSPYHLKIVPGRITYRGIQILTSGDPRDLEDGDLIYLS